MLAGKFLSCGGLLGSIMAGSDVEERDGRTRHYICSCGRWKNARAREECGHSKNADAWDKNECARREYRGKMNGRLDLEC